MIAWMAQPATAVQWFLLTGRLYWLFGRYTARSIKMSVCGSEPN